VTGNQRDIDLRYDRVLVTDNARIQIRSRTQGTQEVLADFFFDGSGHPATLAQLAKVGWFRRGGHKSVQSSVVPPHVAEGRSARDWSLVPQKRSLSLVLEIVAPRHSRSTKWRTSRARTRANACRKTRAGISGASDFSMPDNSTFGVSPGECSPVIDMVNPESGSGAVKTPRSARLRLACREHCRRPD